eukprot:CAMPEP_0197619002 /NCGR_PEP_ID=MMETSP1338-20131121/64_1 /TAXON_ID=43686 ORGANISM="Pelagodinium beii, Strain RCC1491" /NCGR_SAMPLE_ID=MMETSP1338 /ASSEMBLY_ACC=CAM_ASM_000754 /LENGTH=72 /DNA_ID=CAMNT_0043187911 /DNA_START=9 /DNA_END=223 /DNA_ORIENTATION=-
MAFFAALLPLAALIVHGKCEDVPRVNSTSSAAAGDNRSSLNQSYLSSAEMADLEGSVSEMATAGKMPPWSYG